MDTVNIIKDYYNEFPLGEWNRIAGRPEWFLTCRFLDRYIKPGDKVLEHWRWARTLFVLSSF